MDINTNTETNILENNNSQNETLVLNISTQVKSINIFGSQIVCIVLQFYE